MEVVQKSKPIRPLIAAIAIFTMTVLVIALTVAIGRSPDDTYQTPQWAIAIHIATALPAVPLGAWVLLRRKGDRLHKMLGRTWAVLMMVTAFDALWIREVTGHIGPIHIFSAITLIAIPRGIYCIRKGDIQGHRQAMTYSYLGLCSAFVLTLRPDLRIGNFLFG